MEPLCEGRDWWCDTVPLNDNELLVAGGTYWEDYYYYDEEEDTHQGHSQEIPCSLEKYTVGEASKVLDIKYVHHFHSETSLVSLIFWGTSVLGSLCGNRIVVADFAHGSCRCFLVDLSANFATKLPAPSADPRASQIEKTVIMENFVLSYDDHRGDLQILDINQLDLGWRVVHGMPALRPARYPYTWGMTFVAKDKALLVFGERDIRRLDMRDALDPARPKLRSLIPVINRRELPDGAALYFAAHGALNNRSDLVFQLFQGRPDLLCRHTKSKQRQEETSNTDNVAENK